MIGQILTLAGVMAASLAVLAILFLVGMRAKSRLVQGPVVWFSKAFMNPAQLRSAGQPGAYAGVIRHRGRVSGRDYATPVGVVAVADGFLIALPYGTRANWLRNVLASGAASLVTEGRAYEVDRPEIIPMAGVREHFSPSDQRSFRLFRVGQCLRLRRARDLADRPLALAA